MARTNVSIRNQSNVLLTQAFYLPSLRVRVVRIIRTIVLLFRPATRLRPETQQRQVMVSYMLTWLVRLLLDPSNDLLVLIIQGY